MNGREHGAAPCRCARAHHEAKLVVVTGGPGAGKTALLETVRRELCEHVVVLPEAAGVIYGGGFPRDESEIGRRAAQRAIFHVQRELEHAALEPRTAACVLCDRGTIDGVAYWPGDPDELWREVRSTRAQEFSRYAAVLHLRTPPASEYNHKNPLRIETAAQAAQLDARITEAWRGHPRVFVIEHRQRFVEKVREALELIRAEIPSCCLTNTR